MDKKPATFNERIEVIEKEALDAKETLSLLVDNIQQALYVQKEVIDAITAEADARFGTDSSFKAGVSARLEQMKKDKLQKLADQEANQIKGFLEMGALEVASSIDMDSLVVGKPARNGEVLGAGRLTVEISNLDASVTEQLVGKEVGFLWTTPDGGTLEILEIYKKCPPKPVEAADTSVEA